jgi:thiol-disulfide isomerase/thioredoxin
MRSHPRALWAFLAVLVVVLLALPAFAQDDVTISDHFALLKAMVENQTFDRAWSQCHAILDLAVNRNPQTLTGPEWFAVGSAHYYLTAECLQKAVAGGGLTDEDAAAAQIMIQQIMTGTPPGDQNNMNNGDNQNNQDQNVNPNDQNNQGDQINQTVPAGTQKVQVVSHGQQIDLQQFLVPGKTTVIDFYSEFCGPCKALSPRLEDLVGREPDLYLVKVDINRPGVQGIDWDSPVAKQFALRGIPHLKIYGPDRQLISEGDQAQQTLEAWMAQGGGNQGNQGAAATKVQVISHGAEVQLAQYLVPGKTNIIDFYSEFCPPCMALGPRIEQLVGKRDDLVVIKVDINRPGTQGIDWQSPVAKQFSMRSIPHLKLYGPTGALISEGTPARQQVEQWLQDAGIN